MRMTENEDQQREVKKQTDRERQEEDGDARCHAGSSVLIK